jgi:hypothetical protein
MEAEEAVEGEGEGEGGGTGDWMYLFSRQKGNSIRCILVVGSYFSSTMSDHILHGDQTTSLEME